MYTPSDTTPALLSKRAKTFIGSSVFSICNSLKMRLYFGFSEGVPGQNRLHKKRQPALGEFVSNTLLEGSRSVILSVNHIQALCACLIARLTESLIKQKSGSNGRITYEHVDICFKPAYNHKIEKTLKAYLPQREVNTT